MTRSVSAGRGLQWILEGLNVGRSHPGPVLGASLIAVLITSIPSVLQLVVQAAMPLNTALLAGLGVLGLLMTFFILPVLNGGLLSVIDRAERNAAPRAMGVFELFAMPGRALALVGCSVLTTLALLAVVALLAELLAPGLLTWYGSLLAVAAGGTVDPAAVAALGEPPAGMLRFGIVAAIISAVWFCINAIALTQIALRGRALFAAIADGVSGTFRNALPLLVFVLVMVAGGTALMFAIALVLGLLGGIVAAINPVIGGVVVAILLLGLLVLMYAVMYGITYRLWRDICADDTLPPADSGATVAA